MNMSSTHTIRAVVFSDIITANGRQIDSTNLVDRQLSCRSPGDFLKVPNQSYGPQILGDMATFGGWDFFVSHSHE